MYANTTFPLRHDRNAMVVPIDAIVEGDQPYVLLVDKTDHVVKSPVVLGIQGPNFYQVISGVQMGDRVIVGSLSEYQPGQKVTPSPVDLDLTTFTQTSTHLPNEPSAQRPAAAKGGQK
jgi:multidrug efflux pump subunit AcrA (membrane-fusion protein)